MFFRRSRQQKKEREALNQRKMEESQKALLSAATATANAAHDVTSILKTKLEDSVKTFESTSHILKDALLLCNMNGVIQHANVAATTLFGESLVGCNIIGLFEQNGIKPCAPEQLWKMLGDEANWDSQAPIPLVGLKSDGKTFSIEARLERLDWHDKSASMLAIIYDVTAITEMGNDLRRYEARYRSIFESSFDGIIITQNDEIIAANASIERLYGYTADSLLGKSLHTLFKPEERMLLDDRTHTDIRGLHKDGSLLNLIYTSCTINWKNKPAKLITIKESGEMRQFENAIAQQRDYGIDMIVCFDPLFRITFANKAFARVHCVERESLLNKDVRHLFQKEADMLHFMAVHDLLTPDSPTARMQMIVTGEDGEAHVQDWIDYAVFDSMGKAVAFQRVGRDMSAVLASLLPRSEK